MVVHAKGCCPSRIKTESDRVVAEASSAERWIERGVETGEISSSDAKGLLAKLRRMEASMLRELQGDGGA